MWEFNYGEWTEAYVFLSLLGEGKIYGANELFQKDPNVYLNILEILRHEKDLTLKFERMIEVEKVNVYKDDDFWKTLSYTELKQQSHFLYTAIKNITSSERKFPVPESEEYLSSIGFSQPKVPKLPQNVAEEFGKKTDIIITLEDSIDHARSTVGFSIKSHLGSKSSLFNSAPASNLIYEISGCTDEIMNKINGELIDSEIDIFKYIRDNNDLSLIFRGTSDQFATNLDLVDPRMPIMFSTIMLTQLRYQNEVKAKSRKTCDVVNVLEQIDPVNAIRPDLLYKAKIKEFLYDSFAGLTATELWDGRKRLSGGYIDVNKDGEMLYFRAVSDDIFTSYLYDHTHFDRPSRGVNKDIAKVIAKARLSGREATEEEIKAVSVKINKKGKEERKAIKGDWGYVYKNDNRFFINVNFQIRFQ